MGNRKSSLSIDEDNIKLFNQPNTSVRKIGLNRYEFKTSLTEHGKREYLRLDYFDKTLYFGFGAEEQVTVPSKDFMLRVLDSFDDSNCLIRG